MVVCFVVCRYRDLISIGDDSGCYRRFISVLSSELTIKTNLQYYEILPCVSLVLLLPLRPEEMPQPY